MQALCELAVMYPVNGGEKSSPSIPLAATDKVQLSTPTSAVSSTLPSVSLSGKYSKLDVKT